MSSTAYKIPCASELTKLYINGEYVEAKGNNSYTLYNPSNDSIISDKIPIAGEADVDAAIEAAENAFNGPWSEFSGVQRSTCLRKLVDLLEEDDIGKIVNPRCAKYRQPHFHHSDSRKDVYSRTTSLLWLVVCQNTIKERYFL